MTTIGRSITLTGDLESEEDVVVDGAIDGYVTVRNAALTIGAEGRVKADVRGARVLVRGRVEGSIVATERIELAATASVDGSLSANHVVISDGATFNGRIDMDQRTIAAKIAQYRATQRAG